MWSWSSVTYGFDCLYIILHLSVFFSYSLCVKISYLVLKSVVYFCSNLSTLTRAILCGTSILKSPNNYQNSCQSPTQSLQYSIKACCFLFLCGYFHSLFVPCKYGSRSMFTLLSEQVHFSFFSKMDHFNSVTFVFIERKTLVDIMNYGCVHFST